MSESILKKILHRLSRVERELFASYVSWEDLEDQPKERLRRIRGYVDRAIPVPSQWVAWMLEDREINGLPC